MKDEKRKPDPRQDRSKSLVRDVIEAATRVFGKLDYASATTNRIAEIAGVSIGSLYRYFPNKDALIVAVVSRHVDGQLERFERSIVEFPAGERIDDFLLARIREIAAPALANRKLHRFLYERGLVLGMAPAVVQSRERAAAILLELARKDPRPIVAADPELTAFILIQAALGAVSATVASESSSIGEEALCRELTRMAIRSLFG